MEAASRAQERDGRLFFERRDRILRQLYPLPGLLSDDPLPLTQTSSYSDRSLRSAVDSPISYLLRQINSDKRYITTSSCSGRVSVFLDAGPGARKNEGRLVVAEHEEMLLDGKALFSKLQQTLGTPFCTAYDTLKKTPGLHCSWRVEQFCSTEREAAVSDSVLKSEYAPSSQQTLWLRAEPLIVHVEAASLTAAQELMRSLSVGCGLKDVGLMPGRRWMVRFRGSHQMAAPIAAELRPGTLAMLLDAASLTWMLRICSEKLRCNRDQLRRIERFFSSEQRQKAAAARAAGRPGLPRWVAIRFDREAQSRIEKLREGGFVSREGKFRHTNDGWLLVPVTADESVLEVDDAADWTTFDDDPQWDNEANQPKADVCAAR